MNESKRWMGVLIGTLLVAVILIFIPPVHADTTPPEVKISHSPSAVTTEDRVTYTAKASDRGGISKIEIMVNNRLVETCKSSPCTYVGGPYSEGRVSYGAIAYDRSGNRASITDPIFKVTKPVVESNLRLIADVWSDKSDYNPGEAVTVFAKVVDKDGSSSTPDERTVVSFGLRDFNGIGIPYVLTVKYNLKTGYYEGRTTAPDVTPVRVTVIAEKGDVIVKHLDFYFKIKGVKETSPIAEGEVAEKVESLLDIEMRHEIRKKNAEETLPEEELKSELSEIEEEKKRLITDFAQRMDEIELRKVTIIKKLKINRDDVFLDDIKVQARPVRIDVEGREVRIEPSSRGLTLIEGDVKVEGDVEFEYENKILLASKSRKPIRFLPSQVKGKVKGKFKEMKMVDEEFPKYIARGEEEGRLLGFIRVNVATDYEINAENGDVLKEKKPWWKTLVSIKPIAQPPTTEAEEKLQKVSQEAGCEIDRETNELICPDKEMGPMPEYPEVKITLVDALEEIEALNPADSTKIDVEMEVIENSPTRIDLDITFKLPPNLADYPKISPTLLAMYNFVANDCLNNPEDELCPEDRIYYIEKINATTPVDLKLDLTTTHTNINKQFVELDGTIVYFNLEKPVLIGTIGIGRLMDLNERDEVSYISRFVSEREAWNLDDEATNFVRLDHLYDVGQKGKGVKIAVIDAGFRGYIASQAIGGLPTGNQLNYTNFLNTPDNTSTHGRNVAEVVYAVAPEAELYLYRVSGLNSWDDAVDAAIDGEVDILTSSIAWPLRGPGDGTGSVCDIVERAADAGILWFQAVGNDHHKFFHTYYSDPDNDGLINFADNDETVSFDLLVNETINVKMRYNQWGADGLGNATDNFDLYLGQEYANGTYGFMSSSLNNNNLPYEFITFTAPQNGTYSVVIWEVNKTSEGNPLFSLNFDRKIQEYETPFMEVFIPGDSEYAIAVGAVHENDVTASYSSVGPATDGRGKPDFAAPSGFVLPVGGAAIYGTSFSTPFLAAATAVLGDINFKNHAEIYKILKYMTFGPNEFSTTSRGWGVPKFNHTFNEITFFGDAEFTNAGPWNQYSYKMYYNEFPIYTRKTAHVALGLEPGTFFWNGAQHESNDLTVVNTGILGMVVNPNDSQKLLFEYPKWNGLFLSSTGKGHPMVFDIAPKEGDSEIYYIMEEAGILTAGLYKKLGITGKQGLKVYISNN